MDFVDTISLTGLKIFAHHGVLDFERENGQEFLVDLQLGVDTTRAAETDDVADTVHYGELADRIVQIVSGDPVDLIETLAHRIAGAVLEDGRVRHVSVTVHKPQAPISHEFTDVAVTVHRVAARGAGGEDAG